MKSVFILLTVAGLLAGCGSKSATPAAQSTNTSGNPLTAPVDYLSAAANAKTKAIKTVDLATLNQAIQMFNAQENRFPTNLDELIANGLINKVPDAPYGMKIIYDSTSGKAGVVSQ